MDIAPIPEEIMVARLQVPFRQEAHLAPGDIEHRRSAGT